MGEAPVVENYVWHTSVRLDPLGDDEEADIGKEFDTDEESEAICESAKGLPKNNATAPPPKPISNVVDKVEVPPRCFALPAAPASVEAVRWDVAGCDAFVLDGVLTGEECATLITQTDGLWSFWDNAENSRVAFRNAHTIEVTHE